MLANGPSMTRTSSPRSNFMTGFGACSSSVSWFVIRLTSASGIGGGVREPPMKPVIFGVDFTMCQVSLSMSIWTKMYPGKTLRVVVFFWPSLTSTTFSVGTSTSPNYAWR